MAKILCIGDPHFKVDNVKEVDLFIDRLETYAKDVQPTRIICLGDLLDTHERIHTIALNKAYDFVNRLRKIAPTYILVGNHDMCNNQQFLTSNHWMNGMKEWNNVTVVDTVIVAYIEGKTRLIPPIKLVLAPYVYPGRFLEALNTIEDIWEDADCIFAHQEFKGCNMGAIVSTDGDDWDIDNPYVVSGHIHSNQSPQENIYYPGSAMQHAFGESEQNIIAVLTLESGENIEIDEVNLALPRKRLVYKDIEDMDTYSPTTTDDKVKVVVSGVYEQFKAFKKTGKYKSLISTGTKVVFKPRKIDIIKPIEGINHSEIEISFIEILNDLIEKENNPALSEAYMLIKKK